MNYQKLDAFLMQSDKITIFVFLVFFLYLIYLIDLVTGPYVDCGFLYLFPMAIAARYVGKYHAVVLAIFSAAGTSHVSFIGFPKNISNLYIYFDIFSQTILFVAFTLICSKLSNVFNELESLQITDRLTGVRSATSFLLATEVEISRAKKFNQPFSLLLLKIHSMEMSERDGVLVPLDDLLVSICKRLLSAYSPGEIIGRRGYDSFTILFPRMSAESAKNEAARIESLINKEIKPFLGTTIDIILATYVPSSSNQTTKEWLFNVVEKMARRKGNYNENSVRFVTLE